MPPEQAEINPYASPRARAAKPVLRAAKRFRWRLIPTFFLYAYGIGGLLLAVEAVGIPFWLMVFEADRFVDIVRDPVACVLFFGALLVVAVVAATAGCLLIVAARLCWRADQGDWPRAGKLAAIGFGLYLAWGLLMALVSG